MPQLKIIVILFFYLISLSDVFSQNCLDYGEFDDPTCTSLCGPAGWSASGTAYIVEGDAYDTGTFDCSYNVPESPTGGTYQTLWDSNTGTIPGEISTTITGLTPGTEYAFGFWAATPSWICNGVMTGGGIQLSVSIDGVSEIVQTDIGWELFEYCVTASSSSIDIGFTVQETGFVGPAVIDDAYCSDLNVSCCELVLGAEPNLTICPGEELIFELEYENEAGNVDISWESSPPSGMDFLDISNLEQPIFNYDSNQNLTTGTQFVFTATVEDDNCEIDIEVEIDVLPYPEVAFTFEQELFCTNEGEFILPTMTASGIEGEWDIPTIFLQDHPGELISLFFSITDPDVDCPTVTEHFLEVQEEVFSNFNFPLSYCRAHHDIIFFETMTIEGHSGTWNPALIEVDLVPDGNTTITFTPDNPFCITGLEIEIEIYSGEEIEFDLPSVICAGNDLYVFPTNNLNNVPGSWEIESMDLSNISGEVSNTFVSNTIDCYEDYVYTFEVLDELEITFDYPNAICSSDPIFTLESNSIEGYTGQWSTAVINPTQINGNSFINTWTPTPGQSDCITEVIIDVPFAEAIIPLFNFPTELCSLDPSFIFPTISSNQNINGSWNTLSIDPQNGPSVIQNTFTPDAGQCAETVIVEIEVLAPTIPVFNIETSLCQLDNALMLPSSSENGIEGTWSVPSVDPALVIGNELVVTFQADASNNCVENIELIFEIETATIPEFNLSEVLCWNDADYIFPDFSSEGISGTWTIPSISIANNLGQEIVSTFISNDGSCTNSFTANISVMEAFDVVATPVNPSDCEVMDGELQLTGQLSDLEFSIDGGNTWQAADFFTQLGAGLYEILIRPTFDSACLMIINTSLDAPQAPLVGSISSTNIIGCEEDNGSITINVITNDINEYSIDGGQTWQTDNVFENLTAGTYEIGVRNFDSPDCIVSGMAIIEDFIDTEIINITTENISDCQLTDGSIFIEATGENLEYSIDGGSSWSSNPLFPNLGAGNYLVIVQSIDVPDCTENQSTNIIAPGSPIISSAIPVSTTTCFPNSGSITIQTQSADVLFSLNGFDWQEENIFENLEADTYNIYIQSLTNPNCISETEVTIIQEEDSLPVADYTSIEPSDCNEADASLTILINAQDVEFSIDLGVSWQIDPIFNNIAAGNYLVIVRKIGAEDCTAEFFANIDNPACPCNDLTVELESNIDECGGEVPPSVGLISVTGMDNPNYEILWDNGESTAELTTIENGWQVITILYDEDCSWQDSILVELSTPIAFEYILENSDCLEVENGSIEVINITGGNGEYNFSINDEGFQEGNQFENLAAAEYELIIQDGAGCTSTEIVEIISDQVVTIELPMFQNYNLGDTIVLDPQIDAMTIDSFYWTPSTNILNPGELIAQVVPVGNIEYELNVFYGECTERAATFLDLKENIEIYIPNVFNPGSFENNSLYPLGSENIELISFSIYDRWGELIFNKETPLINDPIDSWDGRFNGDLVNPGVFVFMLEYNDETEVGQIVGTVTVIY